MHAPLPCRDALLTQTRRNSDTVAKPIFLSEPPMRRIATFAIALALATPALAALKPGTPITVTIAPAKAGGTVGLLLKMQNEQGVEIVTSGGPGQPPPDPDANRPAAP